MLTLRKRNFMTNLSTIPVLRRMPSEEACLKAERLPVRYGQTLGTYIVDGDTTSHTVYRPRLDVDEWRCSCAAGRDCSHMVAAMKFGIENSFDTPPSGLVSNDSQLTFMDALTPEDLQALDGLRLELGFFEVICERSRLGRASRGVREELTDLRRSLIFKKLEAKYAKNREADLIVAELEDQILVKTSALADIKERISTLRDNASLMFNTLQLSTAIRRPPSSNF